MMHYELPHSNILHVPRSGGLFALYAMAKTNQPEEKSGIPNNGKPTICFVRHPLEWYPSFWAFHQQPEKDLMPAYFPVGFYEELMELYDDDFDTFIQNVIDSGNGFLGRLFAEFTEYADVVGKNETIKDDLINFMSGKEVVNEEKIRTMGYVNKSNNTPMVREDLIESLCEAESNLINQYYESN